MGLDLALVRFSGQTAASAAFGTMRDRVGGDAPWTHEVALVEHHHNGRIALRGTFAGHYVDVDEEDHLSQPGAATGALTGGLIGLVFLGGAIGAESGKATEVEAEPEALVEELRAAVPRGSSAIVLLAEAGHVDAMLAAVEGGRGEVVRRTIDGDELEALVASVGATPAASPGPRPDGDPAAGTR